MMTKHFDGKNEVESGSANKFTFKLDIKHTESLGNNHFLVFRRFSPSLRF